MGRTRARVADPDARVVVMPEVGHMPWVEEPEGFRSAMLEFLD